MRRLLISLRLILVTTLVQAQHGLEKIIVEKYYVSDATDELKSDGKLPKGSVTYRIYADLLPVYRFQAAYGIPGHEMKFSTTTNFYNNEEANAATANEMPRRMLSNKTAMLDSWLSIGAAAEGYYGVLKSDDTSTAVINGDGCLQNADARAEIPINEKDGMYPASPMSTVTFYGLNDSLLSAFKLNSNKRDGQVFITDNGSWASVGGAIGPPPANRVLIAQITTDGIFSFELNIQIGTPSGEVENYVAQNATGKEILFPELIFSSENITGKAK
jgi:hypothetical protein